MTLCRTYRTATLAALTTLALLSACSKDEESACDRWKVAAATFSETCDRPLAYPPVNDDDQVECKTDEQVAEAAKADTADGSVSRLTSADLCAQFLDDRTQDCAPLQAKPGEESYYERYQHCTYGIVQRWTAPTSGDGCTRWKAAARYLSACDPAVFPTITDDAECVPDGDVSDLTDRRFETVAQCADYLYDRAYPCEVPLANRELCTHLIAR